MSFHVFPKGDDRSWTREKYYTINRVLRSIKDLNKARARVSYAQST